MKLYDILRGVNRLVSNSSSYPLGYDALQLYLDTTIDYINGYLYENFLTIQEAFDKQWYKWSMPEESIHLHLGIMDTFPDATENDGKYVQVGGKDYMAVDGEWVDAPEIIRLQEPDPHTFEYTEIPDNYIRSILIYHTAALYLEEEDETEQQYSLYKARANEALERWMRKDYTVHDMESPLTANLDDIRDQSPTHYNPYADMFRSK